VEFLLGIFIKSIKKIAVEYRTKTTGNLQEGASKFVTIACSNLNGLKNKSCKVAEKIESILYFIYIYIYIYNPAVGEILTKQTTVR